jgi:hypothetical protein
VTMLVRMWQQLMQACKQEGLGIQFEYKSLNSPWFNG